MSGSGRRVRLTAAALVLAVLGSLFDAAFHDAPLTETWWPLLVASWAPPAAALATARTPLARPVCLGAALLTGVVAVVLLPYGYGLWQLPTVVLLVLAARRATTTGPRPGRGGGR